MVHLRRRQIGAALIAAAAGSCVRTPPAGEPGAVRLPAREVPPPRSLSEAARSALRAGANRPSFSTPAADNIAGWRLNIATVNAMMDGYIEQMATNPGIRLQAVRTAGIAVYTAVRENAREAEHARAHLYLHGGAWVYGSGRRVIIPAVVNALHFGGVVHAPDFRLPPDHPAPAALEDCVAVYRALLETYAPESILVSGESSGGNIAGGLMHKIKDEGLPKPGALFLNTPVTDLNGESDSLVANLGLDLVLGAGVGAAPQVYLGGGDSNHPYVSPLRGDLVAAFPPTYLRTGTRDLLLSDTVRLHAALRKAGVEADLYVGEAMPHAGFSILAGVETPEDIDAREDTKRWLSRHWGA
jgi:monoterpene epsilon-lactone hydrolase